ncbi:DUF3293 domain-containing protein [Acidithiobacillus montserratensis]|uniref:DUF3293 domain-containing protein n=1 Tax=Acidithiobacillus montserratensis TaxID=2729135 RepID=A0ACD5HC73_9PROT|nr:DUF3293 domain-containing protein [Acidithiobacillus montserratensis]MBN2679399.1 DUF3293 domain-containing protein [Acidithiobacillaceae bacterium]MBU2747103.1 DUF3293 domain-containing protein [Acidithiobacillus montserratensis]
MMKNSIFPSFIANLSKGRRCIHLQANCPFFLEELDRAYRKSHYRIPGKYDFRIGGPAYGVRGVMITAWNPHSQPLSPWKNQHRQHQLLRNLHTAGYPCSRAYCGMDDWWEESVLVHDMSMSEAYPIARRWAQYAFVYLDGRRVWLVYMH